MESERRPPQNLRIPHDMEYGACTCWEYANMKLHVEPPCKLVESRSQPADALEWAMYVLKSSRRTLLYKCRWLEVLGLVFRSSV